eukprot:2968773-Pleurochrysis_carterae.AAC.1
MSRSVRLFPARLTKHMHDNSYAWAFAPACSRSFTNLSDTLCTFQQPGPLLEHACVESSQNSLADGPPK